MGKRRDRPADRIEKQATAYTMGEAMALIGPLVGMAPTELRACLIIGIDRQGNAGVGGTPNLRDATTLRVIEAVAAAMRARGVTPGP